jgi:hypothetical protein
MDKIISIAGQRAFAALWKNERERHIGPSNRQQGMGADEGPPAKSWKLKRIGKAFSRFGIPSRSTPAFQLDDVLSARAILRFSCSSRRLFIGAPPLTPA